MPRTICSGYLALPYYRFLKLFRTVIHTLSRTHTTHEGDLLMRRAIWLMVALVLLLGSVWQAKADFTIYYDRSSFNASVSNQTVLSTIAL